jgi:hypothetical protein
MKTACVIQGDIRVDIRFVLKEMQKYFDVVILSTWKSEKDKIQKGDFVLVLNDTPKVSGYSHRNYQRYSTARGLEKAKELGCDYVLKWRTDMLATSLNIEQLLKYSNYDIKDNLKSRIVMPIFRNLSVKEDIFSTIPDYFAFGHIEMMELLWGDEGFDYTKDFNIPNTTDNKYNDFFKFDKNISGIYCPEAELYAIFKEKLELKINKKLVHKDILQDYTYLIDYNKLGLVWFDSSGGFRSIFQAWEHPWWTKKVWQDKKQCILVEKGYKVNTMLAKIKRLLSPLLVKINIYKQKLIFQRYNKNV